MAKFAELYDECEQLFVEGKTHSEIQAETGVSLTSQTQWKRKGEWETKRAEYRKQNESLKVKLNRLKSKLIDEIELQMDNGAINTQALHALGNLVKPDMVADSRQPATDNPEKVMTKEEIMREIRNTYGIDD